MIRYLPDTTRTRPIEYVDIMLYFQRKVNMTDTTIIFFITDKTLYSYFKNFLVVSFV